MRQFRPFRLRNAAIAILAVTSLPCFADEVAVLKNGFSIQHQRREVVGATTRLYVKADGSSYVDVPTEDIDHFEAAPDLPASGENLAPPSFAKTLKDGVSGSGLPAAGFPMAASPFATNSQNAPPVPNLDEVVNAASSRYRLDPDLVNSVIKAESGFNVRAVSPKGAQGLMQLMPGTASKLGVPDVFDPQANVEGGTKYLRELLERYNFDLVKALAAYNAGPERVEQFDGVPPFYETRAYVARVVRDFNKKKVEQEKAATASQGAAQGKAKSAKTQSSTTKGRDSRSVATGNGR